MKKTLEQWQGQLDKINDKINVLKKDKDAVTKSLEKEGFDCIRGRVTNRIEVYGAFYDMTFYSHFDGHRSSAVYDITRGAELVSNESFNVLKSLIKEYKALPKPSLGSTVKVDMQNLESAATWAVEDFAPEDMYGNILRYFEIVDEDTLKWAYEGNNDQSELLDGSELIIRKSTEKEIKATKTVEKTEYN